MPDLANNIEHNQHFVRSLLMNLWPALQAELVPVLLLLLWCLKLKKLLPRRIA
jgi:hypothetical protein